MRPVTVLFVSLLSLACGAIQATTKLGISDGRVFPTPLGAAVFDIDRSRSYVALSQSVAGSDGQYAVSMAGIQDSQYQGITPEKVRIGAEYDKDNPLFGQKIAHMTLVDHAPLVVSDDQPNRVYNIRNPGTSSLFLLASDPLKLDDGSNCTRVAGVVGFPGRGVFFANLQGAGSFGDADSTVTLGTIALDEVKKTVVIAQGDTRLVNKESPFLKITNDLALVGNSLTMAISEHLQTCYTGLQVKSGATLHSGARALFMGLDIPIAPDAAIKDDSIIGTSSFGKDVRIYHVGTMFTSTGLDYLIVVGGVENASGDKKSSVSALPLVGSGNGFGCLAKKDSNIETLYNSYNAKQVLGRAFSQAAINDGDIPSADAESVKIGGDVTLSSKIEQLLVVKDTVFITLAEDDTALHGGVWSSTAIFDKEGRIAAWTNWAPAGGVSTKSVAGFLDQANGVWYSMRGEKWDDVSSVERSEWQKSSWGNSLSDLFDDSHGVQGVVDFPYNHPAFSTTSRTSLICLTGYGKVAFAQSGYADTSSVFRAISAIGSVEKNSTAKAADAYFWDQGVVAELGAIITAEIVTLEAGSSWLVVGGTNGAAVLCKPDGTGWDTGDLGSNFANFPKDLIWKRFYSGQPVRKICAGDDAFFVLTEGELYRFEAVPEVFLGQKSGVLLADKNSFKSSCVDVRFSDLLVASELALLATDHGLWRTGNGKDIHAAFSVAAVNWTRFVLPESMESVTRLYPISDDGLPFHMIAGNGSNVLVLSASVGRHGANVYRLAITPVALGESVDDDTVALLPDCFVTQWTRDEITKDIYRTYFVSRGDYRNDVATDGALWLFTRAAYAPTRAPAFVECLPPVYRTMSTTGAANSRAIWVGSAGPGMGPLCVRSSDGSWLVGGSRLYGQN